MEYLHGPVFPAREGTEYQKKDPEEMHENDYISRNSVKHVNILGR